MTGVETALTKLHGGGKFGGEGYKVSGGLHGVGVSVVNAFSTRLVVEVDREGKRHRMEFANGGVPQTKPEVVGDAPKGSTGTTVTVWPDGSIFEPTDYSARNILDLIQMMSFLNHAPAIPYTDKRPRNKHNR